MPTIISRRDPPETRRRRCRPVDARCDVMVIARRGRWTLPPHLLIRGQRNHVIIIIVTTTTTAAAAMMIMDDGRGRGGQRLGNDCSDNIPPGLASYLSQVTNTLQK